MCTRVLRGLSKICSSYDTFLLDQFGVLHDGSSAYPGACDALARLNASGKMLVIISNSGQRAEHALEKLKLLGFEPGWFAGVVTSGETTHTALLTRDDPFFSCLGRKCLHLVWISHEKTDEYGLTYVSDISAADFVLVHGMEAVVNGSGTAERVSLECVRSHIKCAARMRVPLVIANPDVSTVDPHFTIPLAGQTAQWYLEEGGPPSSIKLMGKPNEVIYKAALSVLPDAGRVLAVGDSFAHDVRGAANFGIDSLFVATGIHAHEIGGGLNAFSIQALANSHGCPTPTYAISKFQW